ncbi:MAG: hypothetical protein E6J58_09575 [Deltaproteobacteria bacterium]|nr:MAG: hypothetical protein E6J58_09575 [Deltaproteobacteria bacterium]
MSASAVSTAPAAAAFTPPSRATPAANDPATLLTAQRTLRRAKYRPCSGRGTSSAIHRVQELFATTPRIADAPAQQSSTISFTNGENRRKGRMASGSIVWRDTATAARAVRRGPALRDSIAAGNCRS